MPTNERFAEASTVREPTAGVGMTIRRLACCLLTILSIPPLLGCTHSLFDRSKPGASIFKKEDSKLRAKVESDKFPSAKQAGVE